MLIGGVFAGCGAAMGAGAGAGALPRPKMPGRKAMITSQFAQELRELQAAQIEALDKHPQNCGASREPGLLPLVSLDQDYMEVCSLREHLRMPQFCFEDTQGTKERLALQGSRPLDSV
jgi:hypothetical protein